MLNIKEFKYVYAMSLCIALSLVAVMFSGCFKEREPEISYERDPSLVDAITSTVATTTWAPEEESFSWMDVINAIIVDDGEYEPVGTTSSFSGESATTTEVIDTNETTETTETTEFVPTVVFSHQFSSYERGLLRCNEEAAAYGYSFSGSGTYDYDGHSYRVVLNSSGILVVTQLS